MAVPLLLIALTACTNTSPQQVSEIQYNYMPPHETVCHQFEGADIKCSNFSATEGVVTHYYHSGVGSDVMASFSTAGHPGDHPFLKSQPTKLGYLDNSSHPELEAPIENWKKLSAEQKENIIKTLSSNVTAQNPSFSFPKFFTACLGYWSNEKAEFDSNLEPVKIAEVAALCVAQSGILPRVR